MEPVVVPQHKLIFFTQQKVAVTAWASLFRRMMGKDNWTNQDPEYRRKYKGLKYLSDYTLTEASEMMSSPNYTRAIFVRDPKQRFVSAYFDKSFGRRAWYVRGQCCFKDKSKSKATRRECKQLSNSFAGFVNITRTCRDNHWDLQSTRMKPKYLKTLNFVGHMENLQRDAKALLQRIGAWEEFGRDGWGLYGNESIFASKSGVDHANKIDLTAFFSENLTAAIEKELDERFAPDYNVKEFNFTLKALSKDETV